MKKSIQTLFGIILMTAAVLTAGCGVVNTERDGVNDPKSGSYQISNLVLKADGEEIENGGAYFLTATDKGSSRDIIFTIENDGDIDLILTDTPAVEITGEGTSVFSLYNQPNLGIIPVGNHTGFTACYSPDDLLKHSLRMSIDTADGTFTCYIICLDTFAKVLASDGEDSDNIGFSVSISGDRAIVGADQDDSCKGSAYVLHWDGAAWIKEQKLTDLDGAENDYFGYSVSISGERLIVGAFRDDSNKGAAYIYKWNEDSSTWEQEGLKLTGGAADDYFGCSVSISGERVIIGAKGGDGIVSGSGCAYIYKLNGLVWEQEGDKLSDPYAANQDNFGCSVSISGERAIVGAYRHDSYKGASYIYKLNETEWEQEQKLIASDGAADDYFGFSVSISGDRAIVGAYEDTDNGYGSGSAYIYKLNDATGEWDEEQKLTASDAAAYDTFGISVSISGDRAIVGAYQDADNGLASGSAYVYQLDGSEWVEKPKLTAYDGASGDFFGYSVSISGTRMIVGAYGDDTNKGSAYIYKWDSSAWIDKQKLSASEGATDDFCNSVSISGDRAIMGTENSDGNGSGSGSAYMYKWNGASWADEQKLTASDAGAGDHFGCSVSISGDRAIVGAYGGDYNGTAYVYKWNGSAWVEEQKLTAPDADMSDYFGCSVSISGERAIVGAYGDNDNGDDSGSAYIYKWDGSAWEPEGDKLTASDGAEYDNFGSSVSISGERAIVGAYKDNDNGEDSGSAYIYKWDGNSWEPDGDKLTDTDGDANDYFGYSVSISGEHAIVGAVGGNGIVSNSGCAYIYKLEGAAWVQEGEKLTDPDGDASDYFGNSVYISGDRAIVGAFHDLDDIYGEYSGSACIYEWDDGTGKWVVDQKLTATDATASDYFGSSVCISGERVIVSASCADGMEFASGSAYIYSLLTR